MKRFLSLFFAVIVVALLPPLVFAQSDLAMLARFEMMPNVSLYGPHQGTVRLQIGRGAVRAMLRPRMELHIVQGETVQTFPLPKLPTFFDWDTKPVLNGKCRLLLVAIDPATQNQKVVDDLTVTVENPGAASFAEEKPVKEVARPSAPAPPTVPHPRFVPQIPGSKVSGLFSLPVQEWPETAPPYYMPVVDVYRDGRQVDSHTTGTKPPFRFQWDTTSVPNGIYTLKLTVLNMTDNGETMTEELTVVVNNVAKPFKVRPFSVASKPSRATLSSRNALNLALRGSRQEQFHQVMAISKAKGDPFPEVAAAQWALESAWGKSPSGKNNYFGIKARDDEPATEKWTQEWGEMGVYGTLARFTDYESPEHGIAARLAFLKKPRYKNYWQAANCEAACRALQRAGYATDPGYASKLIDVISRMRQ